MNKLNINKLNLRLVLLLGLSMGDVSSSGTPVKFTSDEVSAIDEKKGQLNNLQLGIKLIECDTTTEITSAELTNIQTFFNSVPDTIAGLDQDKIKVLKEYIAIINSGDLSTLDTMKKQLDCIQKLTAKQTPPVVPTQPAQPAQTTKILYIACALLAFLFLVVSALFYKEVNKNKKFKEEDIIHLNTF